MLLNRTNVIAAGVAWTLAFAGAHLYWAVGGTVGVPTGEAITDRPVFLAYDIASAAVLVVAAAIAWRLIDRPTPRLVRLTLVGAALALVRGLIGVVQGAVSVVGGQGLALGSVYDAWFTAVGALFLGVALAGRTWTSPPVALTAVKP